MASYNQAMGTPTYSLQQLSEVSGIEARTIRSYIERDLLPGPYGMGPKAAYGGEHVDRLRVIQRLRETNREMTLDQIRSFLVQLPPEKIAALAAGDLKLGSVGLQSPSSSSALSYLLSLKQGGRSARSARAAAPATPQPDARARAHAKTPFEEMLDALAAALPGESVARAVRSETWHRIPITPDVELTVRGELDPDTLALLQRIGDHLRHLLVKKGTRP